ncbi:plastocyanin/azurin family copper-binding protein [Orrella daihaiensis]|uniref:Azurin n=1 Tax=Orrella daihaiensis TaxID=2782176 RepID=A0ABY4AJV9_9BURK|nr:plastocyanin/azurin family copper-binding protein [Orrella daihaiensis]UOD50579.1 azurin [Orrella daihaiensis]
MIRLSILLLCGVALGLLPGTGGLVAQTYQAAAGEVARQSPVCHASVRVDDSLNFDPAHINVPSTCKQFAVFLSHVGRLPKVASPRNWVLTTAADVDAVARDAELAGATNHWVMPGDSRVLVASSVIGRGEAVRIDLPVQMLVDAVDYVFLSTIPGFSPVLRGSLTVVP